MKKLVLQTIIFLCFFFSCEIDSPESHAPKGFLFSSETPYELLSVKAEDRNIAIPLLINRMQSKD